MGDNFNRERYKKINSRVKECHKGLARCVDKKIIFPQEGCQKRQNAYDALVLSLTAEVKASESKRINVWAKFCKSKQRDANADAIIDHATSLCSSLSEHICFRKNLIVSLLICLKVEKKLQETNT